VVLLVATRPPLPKARWPLRYLLSGSVPRNALSWSVSVPLGRLCGATDTVETERRRTRAERDAFAAFGERVRSIDPTPPRPREPAGAATGALRVDGDERLREVRTAYRETVMSVPHYEAEYDEPLAENVREEFGPELAVAMTSEGPFTPLLKRRLREAADDCRARRDAFLSTLSRERAALSEAESTVRGLEERLESVASRPLSELSFEELIAAHADLEAGRRACEELLEERQTQRTEGHAAVPGVDRNVSDLQTYLYGSAPVTYPILSVGTELLGAFRDWSSRVTAEAAWRF
jgi:hypothetical protein